MQYLFCYERKFISIKVENLRFSPFLLFFILFPFPPSDVCIYASRSENENFCSKSVRPEVLDTPCFFALLQTTPKLKWAPGLYIYIYILIGILVITCAHTFILRHKTLHLITSIAYHLLSVLRYACRTDRSQSSDSKDYARTVAFSLCSSEKHQKSLLFCFFISFHTR